MMQKGICRERPSFHSLPVPCSHKIHQVACYSGIVWVLTEQRHLLARTGIEPGREEGADWKEVNRSVCVWPYCDGSINHETYYFMPFFAKKTNYIHGEAIF